ncbi:MAG: hypothetical protein HRT86_07905 [Ilumatobacteraceae bacterium]|nr:hypothetical protein [Ilumatobacteraceae bacterium]
MTRTDATSERRLAVIIAAAADPYERLEERWCERVVTTPEVLERRRGPWR